MKKIAVIGCGISGLIAAKQLSNRFEVTIFDKSRGIGGRMTTRRATDEFHFDHGAQFFTAKGEEFKKLCDDAKNEGVIDIWQARFAEIDGEEIKRKWKFDEHHTHYVGNPQMNSLCKFLAQNLDVKLQQQISEINFDGQKWSLKTNEEEFIDFDYLISSMPCHQAVNLVPKEFKYFDIIENSKMEGCFALMLGFKKKLDLDFDAAHVKNSIISWISVNSTKPNRPEGFSILLNSSNSWAEENMEDDINLNTEKLISELQKIINFEDADLEYSNIHRWRYANAKVHDGDKSLFDENLKLGVCGDWLISGRVEHAFLSGLDLSAKINLTLRNVK